MDLPGGSSRAVGNQVQVRTTAAVGGAAITYLSIEKDVGGSTNSHTPPTHASFCERNVPQAVLA
jgi:hypothetical protein